MCFTHSHLTCTQTSPLSVCSLPDEMVPHAGASPALDMQDRLLKCRQAIRRTLTSLMGSVKPLGAPLAAASALKLYCVLAMQMGSWGASHGLTGLQLPLRQLIVGHVLGAIDALGYRCNLVLHIATTGLGSISVERNVPELLLQLVISAHHLAPLLLG